MHLPTHVLGKSVVQQLEARSAQPILVIGEDRFTRKQLATIDCFNFAAAARLTHLLTAELKVKNTRDLFMNVPPQHLAIPQLGSISLATLGAAFEAKGLGDLGDYIARHTEKGHTVVTFSTMKINVRDQQAAQQEKRASKARKASRTRQAHELRVERHVKKTGNGNGKTTPTT